MRDLLNQTAEIAARYLEELDERCVAPTPEALARLEELSQPLQQDPEGAAAVLEALDRIGSPATVGTAGRRYFGFVIGGALPAALAANWLAGAWDQNPGLFVASPIGTVLEEISLRWVLDVLKLPAESGGAFVTGATMANFTALAAARNSVLERVGWDVEADGLFGAPPVRHWGCSASAALVSSECPWMTRDECEGARCRPFSARRLCAYRPAT